MLVSHVCMCLPSGMSRPWDECSCKVLWRIETVLDTEIFEMVENGIFRASWNQGPASSTSFFLQILSFETWNDKSWAIKNHCETWVTTIILHCSSFTTMADNDRSWVTMIHHDSPWFTITPQDSPLRYDRPFFYPDYSPYGCFSSHRGRPQIFLVISQPLINMCSNQPTILGTPMTWETTILLMVSNGN